MGRARKPAGAALLCVLLAGCGSSAQSDAFKSGYLAASRPLDQTGTDLAHELGAAAHQKSARIASSFGDLASRFDTELLALDALKPPANVASAFTNLTAAVNRLDDDVRAISVGADRHDVPAVRDGLTAMLTDSSAVNSAAATIRRKLGIK